MWYRTGWSADIQKHFTNSSQRIEHPEQFGLGTKIVPILSEVDQKCLQGVPSIEETHDGQEEGPSTRRGGFLDQEAINHILLRDTEDQPIGDMQTDDKLSTLIRKVEITITETITETAQQTVEAHIRGGEPANENPMQPSPTIASEVRTLQGQNLYGQGNLTRMNNVQSPQRTFGSRNLGGGPRGGGPPRRDPPRGDPPEEGPARGGDLGNVNH